MSYSNLVRWNCGGTPLNLRNRPANRDVGNTAVGQSRGGSPSGSRGCTLNRAIAQMLLNVQDDVDELNDPQRDKKFGG